jgi:ectoine hydroxylase-related dioxygenase (phytanoyl-CoA dioxygenase family)
MNYQNFNGLKLESGQLEIEKLKRDGYFIKENYLPVDLCDLLSEELDRIWVSQLDKYGEKLLKEIGDWGQVRGMMYESKLFQDLIVNDKLHFWINQILGDTCILHLQNGIVLHPNIDHNQAKYHKDFPKDFISSKLLSLNTFIAIDDFTNENGGTLIVPGSHLFEEMPSQDYIEMHKIQIVCPRGSVLYFDSNLWHAGGQNKSSKVRRAINMQWTKPFIKQQLDYPQLMKDKVDLESKLAQKLGMWAIPPKSVDEYRVTNPELRTYRKGQG